MGGVNICIISTAYGYVWSNRVICCGEFMGISGIKEENDT